MGAPPPTVTLPTFTLCVCCLCVTDAPRSQGAKEDYILNSHACRLGEAMRGPSLRFVAQDGDPDQIATLALKVRPEGVPPTFLVNVVILRELSRRVGKRCHSKRLTEAPISRAIFIQATDSNVVASVLAFDDARRMIHVVQGYDSRRFSLSIAQEYHFRRVTVRWAIPSPGRE